MKDDRITLPTKVGQTITINGANGATGYIRKHTANDYSLTDNGNHYRNRWGNAAEIKQDVQHFIDNGSLPKSTTQRW